jgi:NAD+ diphosphatase
MPRSNYYSGMPLVRDEALRRDAEAIERLRADPASRVLALWRYKHLVSDSDSPRPVWHSGEAARRLLAEAEVWALLGVADGAAHFAVDVSHIDEPESVAPFAGRGAFVDLRAIGPLLAREEGSVMAYARGLVYWHRRHRFCGTCGAPAESVHAGHVRRCTDPGCATEHFPRTDPAIIVLVSDGDRCLLGRQRIWPPGMHSTLAGFVEPGESLEEAVIREVREESGVAVEAPVYHSSQPWPFPSSIMLGFHAEASDPTLRVDTEELESAAWYTRDELSASPEDETFRLPRKDSIARRLIEDWLHGRRPRL